MHAATDQKYICGMYCVSTCKFVDEVKRASVSIYNKQKWCNNKDEKTRELILMEQSGSVLTPVCVSYLPDDSLSLVPRDAKFF